MKPVLEHLFAHLRANVDGIATVERWNEQISRAGQKSGYAIATPAVYIKFGTHNTGDSPMGGYRVEGPIMISFVCVTDSFCDIHDLAYSSEADDIDPMDDLVFKQQVHAALHMHGWEQPATGDIAGAYSFTSLQREYNETDGEFDGLRDNTLTYTTNLVDGSGYLAEMAKYETTEDVGLDVEVEPFEPEEDEEE